ncbi:MAG: hypothetical protein NVSMB44_47380 [Ktedonobacteraceae bacterium]
MSLFIKQAHSSTPYSPDASIVNVSIEHGISMQLTRCQALRLIYLINSVHMFNQA